MFSRALSSPLGSLETVNASLGTKSHGVRDEEQNRRSGVRGKAEDEERSGPPITYVSRISSESVNSPNDRFPAYPAQRSLRGQNLFLGGNGSRTLNFSQPL